MSDSRARLLTLAKALIAAAWADNNISEEEKHCLKDIIFHLSDSGLSAEEWLMLEMYMNAPIEPAERARLLADLQEAIRTPAEKRYVLQALQQMVQADGESTSAEQRVIQEMGQAVEEAGVGLLDGLNRLLGGALGRRSAAVANAPNRDVFFEDFLNNRVYFEVNQRLQREGLQLALSETELSRLGLAGGLMARVANVDRQITEAEFEAMASLIEQHWGVSREAAAFVADVAVSALDVNYDYYRMTREFGTSTTAEERRHFLVVLFHIAAADGDISFDETEEIRQIATGIHLSHQDFINAKLQVTKV